jgi:hypothetical protein
MNSIETYLTMKGGKAFYPDKLKFIALIASLPDGFYLNKIEQAGNKRTIKQNNSMWGIPYAFFKRALIESGNYKNISDQQTHEFCMHHCLPEDYKERIRKEYDDDGGMVDMITGEIFKSAFRLTTTKMTTKDAANYYENLQQFYAEWFAKDENDFIPDPDPNKATRT